jgi:hypothetical protein
MRSKYYNKRSLHIQYASEEWGNMALDAEHYAYGRGMKKPAEWKPGPNLQTVLDAFGGAGYWSKKQIPTELGGGEIYTMADHCRTMGNSIEQFVVREDNLFIGGLDRLKRVDPEELINLIAQWFSVIRATQSREIQNEKLESALRMNRFYLMPKTAN